MKKGLQTIAAIFTAGTLSAQIVNEKVIVVNSGAFEVSPPFADYVTVGAYNTYTGSYAVFDTIQRQSAQVLLVSDSVAYVGAESSLTAYNLKTETRIASGLYRGVSPHSLAVSGNTLLAGNWYGQADSFLTAYDATTLAFQYAVPEITLDVRSILTVGDTAYLAQNILGTVDVCGGWGCFNDSIGQLSLVRISTGEYLGTITLGENAAGISNLFLNGDKIVTVNVGTSSITEFDIASQTATTSFLPITVGRGLALSNNILYLELNGMPSKYNLSTHTIVGPSLTSVAFATTTEVDVATETVYQTLTDYTTYGKLYRTSSGVFDSVAVGISPEKIGLYYAHNFAPEASDMSIWISYSSDTIFALPISDETFVPLTATILSGPQVFGATATIDGATKTLHYTSAIGIISSDTIEYQVCDLAGLCDTAKVFLSVGITGIEDEKLSTVSVCPNPFSSQIFISGIEQKTSIQLFDMRGALLNETTLNTNGILTFDNLSEGVYLLHLQSGKATSIVRIVKQ